MQKGNVQSYMRGLELCIVQEEETMDGTTGAVYPYKRKEEKNIWPNWLPVNCLSRSAIWCLILVVICEVLVR
jgi:hypothetical protein